MTRAIESSSRLTTREKVGKNMAVWGGMGLLALAIVAEFGLPVLGLKPVTADTIAAAIGLADGVQTMTGLAMWNPGRK